MFSLRVSRGREGLSKKPGGDNWCVLVHDASGRPWARGARRHDELWVDVPGIATFHLEADRSTLRAIVDDSVGPEAVLDAYYGTVLPLVVQETHGLEVMHGSAILTPSSPRVVAFCGSSEAGKSTIAFGLAARGYSQWADDAVAFRVNPGRSVEALGLPFTPKLRKSSASYFRASAAGPQAPTRLTVVNDFTLRPALLSGIFLLEPGLESLSDRGVELERLTPGPALHAVLSHAYKDRFERRSDQRRRQTIDAYLELVGSVPVVSVRFRRDLDRLPEVLDEIERRVAEAE
jgi:hypothetical protein